MIKLSVLIPTFNRRDRLKNSLSNYTEEKINSVEFLVIDNCSDDDTEDLVQLMIKEDNRIKYFKNPQNLGYNRNLFRGYLEANSNWICILPDDDAIEKGFLSELIEVHDNNKDCSIIISAQKSENGINQIYSKKSQRLKAGTFEALKTRCGHIVGRCFRGTDAANPICIEKGIGTKIKTPGCHQQGRQRKLPTGRSPRGCF